MNISELCIRRPVMTGLLAIAAIVAGVIAYTRLPVAAVPRVDFPVITIFATFPGASPETMATRRPPLEREFSTIAGIDSMSSINGRDTTQITLQFALGRNIDAAAQDVQAAIARARAQAAARYDDAAVLPQGEPGRCAGAAAGAVSSPTLPLSRLDDIRRDHHRAARSRGSAASRRSRSTARRNTPCASGSTPTPGGEGHRHR